MKKNELLNKLKFMEMALEQEEELDLVCKPSYDGWGNFKGLKLFFMSENMTWNAIVNSSNGYCVVLNCEQIKNKKHEIENYINSFCKCDYDIFSKEIEECNCGLPSIEDAEEWWYSSLINKMEERCKWIEEQLN